jgi:hypothetical protein
MFMDPALPTPAVPAESLFPSWRGREPYAERLAAVEAGLHAAHPDLAEAVAAVPFVRFEAAWGPRPPVFKYNDVPPAAAAVLADVPAGLRPAWLCALLCWHVHRFDRLFPETGLPGEFALHYADVFHRLLDQVEGGSEWADHASDSFLKDLWLARLVMIPAFAQVWWPHSGLALRPLLRAPAGIAAFAGCGGRRPFLEGHTHDPVARAYWNEPGWGQALRLAALALPALPHVRGAMGSAWFYDPAVREVSPRVAYAQELQVGRGAWQVRVGSNADAIRNATATSASRRERYEAGTYLPTDWMVIWSRQRLIAAYGAKGNQASL